MLVSIKCCRRISRNWSVSSCSFCRHTVFSLWRCYCGHRLGRVSVDTWVRVHPV